MAGLNPVDVQLSLEPPLTSYMPLNTSATLRVAFVDANSKQPVDPDASVFQTLQPPQIDNPIPGALIRDAVGMYHVVVSFASAVGKWLLQVIAQGNPGLLSIGSGTLVVNVYAAGT
jgi:hypothetical protein